MKKHPPELKERAVRLLLDARNGQNSHGSCARIAQQLGIKEDTRRGWVHRAEVDGGLKPGVTTGEQARLAEHEVPELRRTNATLRSASAFFAVEPDHPSTRGSLTSTNITPISPVEPICRELPIAPQTHYTAHGRAPSKQSVHDEATATKIRKVHESNYGVCGVRKAHAQLRRDGHQVARCTIERLMRREGLRGIRRSKVPRTTIPGSLTDRPSDLVRRRFTSLVASLSLGCRHYLYSDLLRMGLCSVRD
jgi:transposase-like protein